GLVQNRDFGATNTKKSESIRIARVQSNLHFVAATPDKVGGQSEHEGAIRCYQVTSTRHGQETLASQLLQNRFRNTEVTPVHFTQHQRPIPRCPSSASSSGISMISLVRSMISSSVSLPGITMAECGTRSSRSSLVTS